MTEDRMLSDEILLGLIKRNSGGGGTSNYNDLSNKPQIGGTTLTGNKSASDLGLVAAETGKGLSTNDYTDADKAIVEGVTVALAGKQDVLTAGDYVSINNGEIKVTKSKGGDLYEYKFTNVNITLTVTKYVNKTQISQTSYQNTSVYQTPVTMDDIIQFGYNMGTYNWWYKPLIDSKEHVANTVIEWNYTEAGDYTESFNYSADTSKDLVLEEDLTNALALKQNATDNSLDTEAKTIVGAINEHEGDIGSLKSGFTNLDNEVNGDATEYPYADVITIEDAVPSNLAECNVKIEPVQSGSGDPSPTNIRPITGHTEASVKRDGFNIWNGNATDGKAIANNGGTYNSDNNFVTGYIRVYPGVKYYVNRQNWESWIGIYDSDKQHTVGENVRIDTSDNSIIFAENVFYARFTGKLAMKQSACLNIFNESLNGTYEPYQGKTYTIAIGDTVYGGTVNFNTGVMAVTMAQIASYDGETIGEPWISDRDVYAEGTTPTTGAQVVYTLATPTTIQLTPQQIQLLQGQNTITASTVQISVTANGVSGSIGQVQEQVNATDAAVAELAEQLPDAPTTDGAYVLTVTVADGAPTYSWESAT